MSTWVLLRGWAREARHWGSFPAQLAAALGGIRIVAADLPGSGKLYQRRSPWRIGPIAEDVRQALALSGPLYLLGISMGAMVSVEWARRHGAEIAGCVLLNTSLRPFSAFHERLRPRTYATLARLALFEREPRAREEAILRLTSAGAPSGALVAEWARYAQEQPVSRGNVLRQLVAAAGYRAPESPPAPVLVLASRRDDLVDVRCSFTLATRWQVPICVHESAGHDLALDDGAWVAARVADWVRRS